MIVPLSYVGSIVLYVSVFWFSAFISGQKMKSRMLQIAIMSFLPFLIAGFRYNVGWDYNSYSWGFDLFDANTSLYVSVHPVDAKHPVLLHTVCSTIPLGFVNVALSNPL